MIRQCYSEEKKAQEEILDYRDCDMSIKENEVVYAIICYVIENLDDDNN